jgi:hypothetical protein
MWIIDTESGEYFQETWISHYSHTKKYGHTHRIDIWEYSKNCWVAADSSIYSGGNYMNMRGFLPTAQAVMEMEDYLNDLVTNLISEIKMEC